MPYGGSAGNSVPVGNGLEQSLTAVAGDVNVVFTDHDAAATFVSIVDTFSTSYTRCGTGVTLNGEQFDIFVGVVAGAGANLVRLNLSTAPGDGTIIVIRETGRDLVTPLGDFTFNVQVPPLTANGVTCGPVTALAGDDVLMGMTDAETIRANNYTAGTGFTERIEVGSGTGSQIDSMVQGADNVAAGAITGVATAASTDLTSSGIVCIKAAGASVVADDADAAIPAFLLKPPAPVLDILIAA